MRPEPGKYVIQDENGEGWCILATIIVLNAAGCRDEAVDQVISVAQKLQWTGEDLTQLRLALAEALQTAPDRHPADSLLMVRVFLRLGARKDVIVAPLPVSAHEKAGQGWGFFIVQKRANNDADRTPLAAGQLDLIELFLYQE